MTENEADPTHLTPEQELRLRALEVAGNVIRSQDLRIGHAKLEDFTILMARRFVRWVEEA